MTSRTKQLLAAATISAMFAGPAFAGPCPCDTDLDGEATVNDLLAFLAGYFEGSPTSDFNFDGLTNIDDLLGFISCFFAGCPETVDVLAGLDLYESIGQFRDLQLPPDFFGPSGPDGNGGELVFIPQIDLIGQPIGTFGPFETGTTDTVMERYNDVFLLDEEGATAETEIQLVELNLVSVQPIQVQVQNQPTFWDVHVSLENDESTVGVMTVTKIHENGGTYDAEFLVKPVFTFVNLDDPRDVRQLEMPGIDVIMNGFTVFDMLDSWPLSLQAQGGAMDLGPASTLNLFGPQFDLSLNPAQEDPGRPPAFVQPGANVDPGVASLGRFANIAPGAFVGAGTVIGPNAFIGPNATIGNDVVIDENVQIMDGATVEDGAHIYANSVVGPFATVGAGTVLDVDVFLGDGALIGPNSYVTRNTNIGFGADIGHKALIGENVVIGDFAQVIPEMIIASGANVAPNSLVDESIQPCMLLDGSLAILPLSQCSLLEGYCFGRVPPAPQGGAKPVGAATQQIALLDWLFNIFDVIQLHDAMKRFRSKGVIKKDGTTTDAPWLDPDHPDHCPPVATNKYYKECEYDCVNFADALERELEDLGITATFTILRKYINKRYEGEGAARRLVYDEDGTFTHAITDVHIGNSFFWVEPQAGPNDMHDFSFLDADGDGDIETHKKPGGGPTESGAGGCYGIEVYDSFAEAKMKYNAIWPGYF